MLDVLDGCSFFSQIQQRLGVTTELERVELGLSAMVSRLAKHLQQFCYCGKHNNLHER